MSDKPMVAPNLFHDLAGQAPCPGHLITNLSSEQLAALHSFKHEFAAAGFRLYKDVPPKEADAVLRHFLAELLEKKR
ncbi:MAG: hypothetical protein JO111_03340 [Caulobacteraceae bacterium]|nr:hypothetical protein [Caulobacteraceae bacterium]